MTALKIMTMNVRGSHFEIDGAHYWPYRAGLAAETVLRHAPHIIGFQEFQTGNRDTFDQALPDYEYTLGPISIDNSDWGMWNPIYWLKSRFDRQAVGGFYLTDQEDVWQIPWDAMLVRAATWARLRDRSSGRTLVAVNTHLDHVGELSRVSAAQLIIGQIAAQHTGLPVVIMGDFNSRVWAIEENGGEIPPALRDEATPPGTVHSVFTRAGFVDTWLAAGYQEGPHTNTFHNFQGAHYPAIGQRIDWVLLHDSLPGPTAVNGGSRGWRTEDCEIITDHSPSEAGVSLYPSDHYPVLATVTLF
ncbi:MAG: endonuclease/exonuclease/phosphatase family protein [Chloroflexota bacterium]